MRTPDPRQMARAAAIGGGALLGVTAATAGLINAQRQQAKRIIGPRVTAAPYDDGRYGRSKGPSKRLVIIGDSVAAGLGADLPSETIGARLAQLVSDYSHQAVVLSNVAMVGARTKDLEAQVTRALHYRPHVAVIIIGGNDVTHAVRRSVSVERLDTAIRRLRAADVQVVVGTTPDFGTVQPIRPPLRWLLRELSRSLAAAQAVAVVRAGGRAVSLGDLLGPEFSARPGQLFSADQFHPSTEGYEAVAQVLAPAVLAALSRGAEGEILPELYTATAEAPLLALAATAAEVPGTEVTGEPGRHWWARARRRDLTQPLPDGPSEAA
ncbi:MAG: SGNH/GDSL hydrolase family protein [Candidatus Nanopelagicales bacterium]